MREVGLTRGYSQSPALQERVQDYMQAIHLASATNGCLLLVWDHVLLALGLL
jgi:hypothetical protein